LQQWFNKVKHELRLFGAKQSKPRTNFHIIIFCEFC